MATMHGRDFKQKEEKRESKMWFEPAQLWCVTGIWFGGVVSMRGRELATVFGRTCHSLNVGEVQVLFTML